MAKPEHITNEAILEALSVHPGVTAPELAAALGIGQSTAAKRLATLEGDGQVCRDSGGADGGRRVAHRWSALAATPGTSVEAIDTSRPATSKPRTAAPEKVTAQKGAALATPSNAAAPGSPLPNGDGNRLGRGVLGALVLDYLAARPEESVGPSAVGKALGRSGGAVSNSLAAMAIRGEVLQVSDKPRRYRIATSK